MNQGILHSTFHMAPDGESPLLGSRDPFHSGSRNHHDLTRNEDQHDVYMFNFDSHHPTSKNQSYSRRFGLEPRYFPSRDRDHPRSYHYDPPQSPGSRVANRQIAQHDYLGRYHTIGHDEKRFRSHNPNSESRRTIARYRPFPAVARSRAPPPSSEALGTSSASQTPFGAAALPRTQSTYLAAVRRSAANQAPTCFFWYHGRCGSGPRCKMLHTLTEPPTIVVPPPGYIHWDECDLRLCALRTNDEPEGLRFPTPVKNNGAVQRHKNFDKEQARKEDRVRAHSNKITKRGKAKKNKRKQSKKMESAAARPLLSAENLVQEQAVEDVDKGSTTKSFTETTDINHEVEWFLTGFE